MMQSEVQQRLLAEGYQVWDRPFARLAARALNSPQAGRPAGAPGHRNYSELDYRRIRDWVRVHDLCGDDRENGGDLRRKAADLLAHNSWGYVWISDGEVGWSALPPVGLLARNGVATCWPVRE